MIKGCKICGISDLKTLNHLVNHPYPPNYIGFICNYKKSPRFVQLNKLKELLNINKKKSKFVAVLVKPDDEILEKIKNLSFDYYQLYDCSPDEIKKIKKKYKIKIIEDCAEAIGTKFNKKYVGSVGDVSTFSFYGNKTISTGEGGMLITKKTLFISKL